MEVTATAVVTPTQACNLYDRLAWVFAQAGPAGGEYRTPAVKIADDGSFAIAGESCRGNFCGVGFDATTLALTLVINSRRSALWDTSNCAGMVFSIFRQEPRSSHEGRGWWPPGDLDILSRFIMKEYKSWRTDVPFWECSLTASSEMDRQRTYLTQYLLRWHSRDYWVIYNPGTQDLVVHNGTEILPFHCILDSEDYRRLAVEGIKVDR